MRLCIVFFLSLNIENEFVAFANKIEESGILVLNEKYFHIEEKLPKNLQAQRLLQPLGGEVKTPSGEDSLEQHETTLGRGVESGASVGWAAALCLEWVLA